MVTGTMLEKLSLKTIIVLVFASIALFVLFSIIMTVVRTITPPLYTIVDLEFSWTAAQADAILQAWGSLVVAQELYITYLDFGYLIGYGGMAFWLLVLGTRLVAKNQRMMKAGIFFAYLSIASPLCDVIENLNLIPMMQAFPVFPIDLNALVASVFATVKFGILFLSIGVFAIEVLFAIATRRRS